MAKCLCADRQGQPGEPNWFPERAEDAAEAVAVCVRCPSRLACAQTALRLPSGLRWGVWAGHLLPDEFAELQSWVHSCLTSDGCGKVPS